MADTEIVEKYTPNFEAWVQDFTEWQTRIDLTLHGWAITDLISSLIGIRLEKQ